VRRRPLPSLLLAAMLVLASTRPGAQRPRPATPDETWQRIVSSWTGGDYPAALDDALALLRSPAAPQYLERVALLTGELFITTTLSADGRNARIARAGSPITFETGPAAMPVTHVVRLAGGVPVEQPVVNGLQVSISPSGRTIAYLRPRAGESWMRAVTGLAQDPNRMASLVWRTELGRSDLVVRDLDTNQETTWPTPGLVKTAPMLLDDRRAIMIGARDDSLARNELFLVSADGDPVVLADFSRPLGAVRLSGDGRRAVVTFAAVSPFGGPQTTTEDVLDAAESTVPTPCGSRTLASPGFAILTIETGAMRTIAGLAPVISDDGSTVAWLEPANDVCVLRTTTPDGADREIARAPAIESPALSADGSRVAFQQMTGPGWDIYATGADGGVARVTTDPQHDVLPRFLGDGTLLAMTGEPRHRRAFVYDLATGVRRRLFANNTLRTISPEYAWTADGSGRYLLVQADRDGDTVSPARGLYLVDRSRTVDLPGLIGRLERERNGEVALRDRMTRTFAPLAATIARTVAGIDGKRIEAHERALAAMGSKFVSEPGNGAAIAYLTRAYRAFGYTPDLQWFEPAASRGRATANVLAIKRGTLTPSTMYVVSSHFDSVPDGPGADDDGSGTAALLETARVLARVPLAATVVFASLTGEEAGLLGSEVLVARARAARWQVAGVLNNDMIGWAGDGPALDNTVRYASPAIRDVQHGAAFLFTRLVTYDAKYYKGTDAESFAAVWGDIIGGLGSYPVLGNPNYHQPTDTIDTVSIPQIAESAKVTAASLVYLASAPAPVRNLAARRRADGVSVTWTPAAAVRSYTVTFGPPDDPGRTSLRVTSPAASLPPLPAGSTVAVRALSRSGIEGWDWTRVVLQ
jgi:hypothetical protein